MAGPKTTRDVRATRSVDVHRTPTIEEGVPLHLQRLTSEKARIEKQIELWLRKEARLRARLTKVERQMEELHAICPSATIAPQIEDARKPFLKLQQKMAEIRPPLGLEEEYLNLNLVSLGDLT